MDEDGTFWTYSLSFPFDLIPIEYGSIRAVDRYWGYKLKPLDDGKRTRVKLVCQSVLNGWMPQPIVNWQITKVLAHYLRGVEKAGQQEIAAGRADALLEQFGLPPISA